MAPAPENAAGARRPELLAPAGDLSCGLAAFEAGADAVYLGLKGFSARQAATNFDLQDLRRLKGRAAALGRRVHVALNTLVLEEERPALAEALAELELIGVDGIIVQDLGVLAFARERFPRLAVHASTQMALRDDLGLDFAAEHGIRRVVLPRETTLVEVRRLRAAHPGLELEVFVHGALCYSVSGMCLASGLLTGRSANRGRCAQVCRAWFERRGRAAYSFSCGDLVLGRHVLDLAEAGVAALKIEGRMKERDYVSRVVRLYRRVLDAGMGLDGAGYRDLAEACALTFQRRPTRGWLLDPAGEDLLDDRSPGNRGLRLGEVAAAEGRVLVVALERELRRNDMLMHTCDPRHGGAVRFNAFRVTGEDGGRLDRAPAGSRVRIECPDVAPPPGTEIRLIGSTALERLPAPDEKDFPPARASVPLRLVFRPQEAVLAWSWRGQERTLRLGVDCARATGGTDVADKVRQLFAEAGASRFTAGPLEIANESGFSPLFIPPSHLKKLRTAFYQDLEAAFDAGLHRLRKEVSAAHGGAPAPEILAPDLLEWLSLRRNLSPPGAGGLPFARLEDLRSANLAGRGGWHVVPLHPLLPGGAGPWAEALRELIAGNPGERFLLGVNNPGHAGLLRGLPEGGRTPCFLDVFAYAANTLALGAWRRQSPGLRFAYAWIEGREEEVAPLIRGAAPFPVLRVRDPLSAPLFLSLAGLSWPGGGTVANGGAEFEARLDSGVAYLFRKHSPSAQNAPPPPIAVDAGDRQPVRRQDISGDGDRG